MREDVGRRRAARLRAACSRAAVRRDEGLARELAAELVVLRPGLAVDSQARALRRGKVLVDWGQNAATRSLAAPYTVRVGDAPRVSTPLAWDELERDPGALVFSPREVLDRVERLGDLFAPLALR